MPEKKGLPEGSPPNKDDPGGSARFSDQVEHGEEPRDYGLSDLDEVDDPTFSSKSLSASDLLGKQDEGGDEPPRGQPVLVFGGEPASDDEEPYADANDDRPYDEEAASASGSGVDPEFRKASDHLEHGGDDLLGKGAVDPDEVARKAQDLKRTATGRLPKVTVEPAKPKTEEKPTGAKEAGLEILKDIKKSAVRANVTSAEAHTRAEEIWSWLATQFNENELPEKIAQRVASKRPADTQPLWLKYAPLALSALAVLLMVINLATRQDGAALEKATEAANKAEALRQLIGTPGGGEFDPNSEVQSLFYTREGGHLRVVVGPKRPAASSPPNDANRPNPPPNLSLSPEAGGTKGGNK